MTNVYDECVILDGRFWIDINPNEKPFVTTFAVVDEFEGGVVAYFNDLKLALHFARTASEAHSYEK